MKKIAARGSIMLFVIVFGGIFFTLPTALSSFVIVGNRAQDIAQARAEAFNIAEAGLEYYRWFLSHFWAIRRTGPGRAAPTSFRITTLSGTVGTYTLSIVGNSACGAVQSIDVTSRGVPERRSECFFNASDDMRSIGCCIPYIVGSSVWAGPDRIINGPYHCNGGVRMDGIANAPVSSSSPRGTARAISAVLPTAFRPGRRRSRRKSKSLGIPNADGFSRESLGEFFNA